jgi:hypothetical protein
MKSHLSVANQVEFLQNNVEDSLRDFDFPKIPFPDEMSEFFIDDQLEIIEIQNFNDFLYNNSNNPFNLDLVLSNNEWNFNAPTENNLDIPPNHISQWMDDLGRDAFGCYYPYHYYYSSGKWGIYIYMDVIHSHVQKLTKEQPEIFGIQKYSFSDLYRLYAHFVHRHELFHFQVELFTTNVEICQLTARYIPSREKINAQFSRSEHWLEEALAESTSLNSRYVGNNSAIPVHDRKRFYEYDLKSMPAGYRDYRCESYGGPINAHKHFATQLTHTSLYPTYNEYNPIENTVKSENFVNQKKVPTYLVYNKYGRFGKLKIF